MTLLFSCSSWASPEMFRLSLVVGGLPPVAQELFSILFVFSVYFCGLLSALQSEAVLRIVHI